MIDPSALKMDAPKRENTLKTGTPKTGTGPAIPEPAGATPGRAGKPDETGPTAVVSAEAVAELARARLITLIRPPARRGGWAGLFGADPAVPSDPPGTEPPETGPPPAHPSDDPFPPDSARPAPAEPAPLVPLFRPGETARTGGAEPQTAAGKAAQAQRAAALGARVARVARAVPFRALCLQQTLALRRMLHRRGVASTIRLGVSPDRVGDAHAWLIVNGRIVIGGGEVERFRVIAEFPPIAPHSKSADSKPTPKKPPAPRPAIPKPPPPLPGDLKHMAAIMRGRDRDLTDDDWRRVLESGLRRHRMGPFLADLLRDRPPNPRHRAQLAAEAETGARAALIQKAETERCLTALRRAGIAPILIKGWPLGERLYGSAALRHAKDIDFLVRADEMPRAIRAISGLGYAPQPGQAARMRLAMTGHPALFEEANDVAFIRPDGRQVELHWRLTHMQGWIELEDIPDAVATHPMDGGGEVAVLSDRAALIYLSVHGQLHLWGRMKWLLDIARLFETRSPEDLSADHAIAARLRAGRAVRIAAAMAHRVMGAPLPEDWPAPDWLERRAIAHFLRLMARPGGAPGTPEARAQYYLCAFAFGEGTVQRLASPRYALLRNLRLWQAARRTR